MRRYVALIQVMTDEKDKEFIAWLNENGFFFWHWIDGGWLLVDPEDRNEISSASLRDVIRRISEDKHCLVFEVNQSGPWAGFGPKGEQRNMFPWIEKKWTNPAAPEKK